ncbi:MAG: TlpA family protein disulfide reductase [Alphaproteobacteria bacterium]|nr:TlpA family protein disulfide reductase [Alphaproteobacteria bacterium]
MSFWKKKDNLIITGFVVLFFAGLAVWVDLCCVNAAFFSPSIPSPYDVLFIDKDGNSETLSNFKGKPLIVNLWATWCPSCVKKMASFHRFTEKFEAAGGKVLNISQDSSGGPVRAYYARNGFHFPLYLDSKGLLLDAFKGTGVPTTIFISAAGQEVGRISGSFDWDSSEAASLVQKSFGLTLTNK